MHVVWSRIREKKETKKAGEISSEPPTLRALGPSVFLPALVYEIGNGAIAPIIALTVLDIGGSLSQAGIMLALLGIGRVLADLPASWLASRIGDRRAMLVSAVVDTVGLLGCLMSRSLITLAVSVLLIGAANATFYLARQSYLTEIAPVHLRARAMSTLGGSHRIGLFIGPFLGAAAIGLTSMRAAYLVAVVAAAVVALLLVLIPDVTVNNVEEKTPTSTVGMYQTIIVHRRLFATLGMAIFAVAAIRAAREVVLPLWAAHLLLSPERTSVLFGVAGLVDMALFYPAGKLMDRFGRLAAALPSVLILAASVMVLPLSSGFISLAVLAMAMGFGNGISTGVMMTLGADAAPNSRSVRFLGVWRLLSDLGSAAGPSVVALVAAAWTLAAGIVAVSSFGLFAAGALAIWVPKYSLFATPAAVRASREQGS